jgi:hypothetical protein
MGSCGCPCLTQLLVRFCMQVAKQFAKMLEGGVEQVKTSIQAQALAHAVQAAAVMAAVPFSCWVVFAHVVVALQEYARLHFEALKRDLLRGPDKDFIN